MKELVNLTTIQYDYVRGNETVMKSMKWKMLISSSYKIQGGSFLLCTNSLKIAKYSCYVVINSH